MPESPAKNYEEIEHTADWALKVWGQDIASLFTNAALGMMELAGIRLSTEPGAAREIELRADDRESLLVDWLHELLLAVELEQHAFKQIELEISDSWRLTGSVRLVPIASIEKPIKAVTYNELQIGESSNGLEATIVFDV